jgi:hypothetical protein
LASLGGRHTAPGVQALHVVDLPEQARSGPRRLQPQPGNVPFGMRRLHHDPRPGGDHLAAILDRLPGRPRVVQGHRPVTTQNGGRWLPKDPDTSGAVIDLHASPQGTQDEPMAVGDLQF